MAGLFISKNGDALVSNPLSQFASTSSSQIAGVISDETGYSSGALLVFSKSPSIDTPTVTGVFKLNQSTARSYQFETRSDITTEVVSVIRPSSTNATIAVDFCPNGNPGNSPIHGAISRNDICDRDISSGGDVKFLTLNISSTICEVGSRASGSLSASILPLVFTMNAVEKGRLTNIGNWDFTNTNNGQAYLKITNAPSGTKTTAYAEISCAADTATGMLRTYSSTFSFDGGLYQNKTDIANTSAGLVYVASGASGTHQWLTGGSAISTKLKMTLDNSGRLGIGITPTAMLTLMAGTATAGTAPLKFTAGTNLTSAVAGSMEYDGTNLFFTRTGTTREGVLVGNRGATAPSTSAIGALISYFGSSSTVSLNTPDTWFSVVGDNGTTYKIPGYL